MSAERLLPRVIYAYQVNRVHFRFFVFVNALLHGDMQLGEVD